MIYPEFLKNQNIIGITAPSGGARDKIDLKKIKFTKENLEKNGFKVKITKNCYTNKKGRSSNKKTRAKELEKLYKDKNIKAIICYSGGEFLIEMLPELDLNLIKQNPKWIQGYSDPTSLLFIITTNLDIATIYGANSKQFAMNPMHISLKNNLEILKGNIKIQTSFKKYQEERIKSITGDEPYNLNKPVKWQTVNNKPLTIKGRLIDGCLECLLDIIGTKYDKTKEFIEKYKDDGIIWYFDNYALTNEDLLRAFWRLKESGWFNHTKGIILGRYKEETFLNITLKEITKDILKDIPLIYNADIGHILPQITLINGSLAHIKVEKGKGQIALELK